MNQSVTLAFVAVVRCVQVSLELARAAVRCGGNDILQALVRYVQFTRPSSRAFTVQVAEHVHSTADVAVVNAHTATDGHSPVLGVGHHHYLAVSTHWSKLLGVADLTRVCNDTYIQVTSLAVTEVRGVSARLFDGTWRPLLSVITTLYNVAISIFYRRALSLGCACIRRSGIILIPYATFVPNFVSVAAYIAKLAHEEKSRYPINQSITFITRLFDDPENRSAYASEYICVRSIMCLLHSVTWFCLYTFYNWHNGNPAQSLFWNGVPRNKKYSHKSYYQVKNHFKWFP